MCSTVYLENLTGVHHPIVADVADLDQSRSIFAEVGGDEGRIDALINNAAIQICKPLVQTSPNEWDSVMATNLRSVYLAVRHAYPLMRNAGGVILNVSSVHALATSINLAAYAATPEVVHAVVERNDKRYKVLSTAYTIGSMAANLNAWRKFAKQYSDDKMLERKADVIMRSRDKFTRDRGWGLSDIGIGLPNTVYIAPFLRVSMYKEGETRLIHEKKDSSSTSGSMLGGTIAAQPEWTWKGKDTLSLHVEEWGCSVGLGGVSCGWSHQEMPIGWGEAYIKKDVEYCEDTSSGGFFSWFLSSSGCPRWMKHNRLGERLADMEKEKIDANYKGVRAYYDLQDLSKNNKDPRLSLSVEVEVTGGDVRTSSKVKGIGSPSSSSKTLANGMGPGVFRADDQMASESMASIATAEVYFKRPEKLYVDGKEQTEYANLFNPYWQVRLKETTKAQRYAAWAIRATDLATKL